MTVDNVYGLGERLTLDRVIRNKLVELIQAGVFTVGDKLPPERELASRFAVSRTALREALQHLEHEGYISRQHGVGTFVTASEPPLVAGLEQLESITEFIRSRGRQPGTTHIEGATEAAGEQLAGWLNLEAGQPVYCFKRVRTAGGQPFAYDIAKMPLALFDGQFPLDELDESVFALLEEHQHVPQYARCSIYAVGASPAIAAKLAVDPGTALQVLKQVHFDANHQPLLYGESYIRSDVLTFHLIRRRTT